MNNTYFGLLAEFGEANILLAKVAPKYFGLSFEEARRRAPTQLLPCRVFRLGGFSSRLCQDDELKWNSPIRDQRAERA